ncbi:DUF354 domain-containing protein [Methanoculleus sp. FWC-SCC1]|uniref:DUF354 domain-containing protein n=1 Tax=Methanoculleus frigidifontis TaxID=2584085 RepID=A0ABT8M704_9EURY|nr:DUF354 domain-containing protein [Methanoculleus sp. FWC-SCC1]MDN7023712.1 DUF354 domain-containing protein [Methanoculleus sp. FWC-SCC1]
MKNQSLLPKKTSIDSNYPSGPGCLEYGQPVGGFPARSLPQPYSEEFVIHPAPGKRRIWIDLINPSDVLFFNALMHDLTDFQIAVTYRERAETVHLGHSFGIEGTIIGRDGVRPVSKILLMAVRTAQLLTSANRFDVSMSFENGMSTLISKVRGKTSFQFCDNDLKFIQKTSLYQDLETKIKLSADYLVIPRACSDTFGRYVDDEKIVVYDGYKEDIYLADYTPDARFREKVPYERFVVVRPEALDAFYVKEKRSIVPAIIKGLVREGMNIVYLPRNGSDRRHVNGSSQVFIPDASLHGLDLCHYADAVLTGSGTMAREAACMGKKSVSFFPSEHLLSVDRQLVDDRRVLHSRDPEEIVTHVLDSGRPQQRVDRDASRLVKQSILNQMESILAGE